MSTPNLTPSPSSAKASAVKSTNGKPKTPTIGVVQIPQSMQSALEEFNNRYCLVELLPGIAVLPTAADPEIHIYSRGEFIQTVHSNRIIGNQNVALEWMKWPNRRQVKRLTYAPGKPQFFDGLLNTWLPSSIEPKEGDISLFTHYINHIFQSDATDQDWFIAWLAHQFQFPGVKLHSAVVFWSSETSTGKSFFGYLMAELFGTHNFAEINETELHGSFNFWAARKQFVMGEEIKGSNQQKQADFLKSVITRKFVTINTKNTPHYTLPDCINYFFTSNRENAFLLDETDRRFFVHRLADVKLDADYVARTLKPWLQNGGYSAVLHYLLNVDLTKPLTSTGKPFNPFGPPPETSARKAMIDAGREIVDIWLSEVASSPGPTMLNTPGWKLTASDDLYDLFCLRYPRERVKQPVFAAKVRKLFKAVRGGNVVPIEEGKAAKRLWCLSGRLQGYEGASLASLVEEYNQGRE